VKPRNITWPVALLLCLAAGPLHQAQAWGPNGHQIVARIAELNLSDNAKKALADLLPDTDFSGSSSISDTKLDSFADFVRHNSNYPQYSSSGPWHFVDIPVKPKTAFDPKKHCKGYCALAKIEDFRIVLADKTLARERRQEALVFLVHITGDLHQPLHCATRNDTGGNDLKVSYLGTTDPHMNLHSVWDGNLVHDAMPSPDPIKSAEKYNKEVSDADKAAWAKTAARDWMLESYEIARTKAYFLADGTELPEAGRPNLDKDYVAKNKVIVASQLKKGGIRLAKLLNDALDPAK
jgi:hypothetical protein